MRADLTRKFGNRIWNSATLMTWGSALAQLLLPFVVLPLLLTRFSIEEITIWLLFYTIISLQMLADMGFSTTFVRVIAFGMGGAESHQLNSFRALESNKKIREPNWDTIGSIITTMRPIYTRLSLILFVILAVFGTWALVKPVSVASDISSAWLAWAVVLLSTTLSFRGNAYSAYLQGINQIALLRRWETLFALGAVITSVLVLIAGGKLLALIITTQAWVLLTVLRNRWLCHNIEKGRFKQYTNSTIDKETINAVWPSAWRSGVGVLMGFGIFQGSGIVYAQFGSALSVAAYLLALRIIQIISAISQAPFYTKLPMLARLRSQGDLGQQVQLAKRGMSISYWVYVLGFIAVGILADPFLILIKSNADFVNPFLWSLIGIAIFVERYGAMHIQLYSTTNHIIWHIANGVSGVIFIVISFLLFNQIGVYAFPIALLIGYLGFYSWYSAKHSYKAFGLKFLPFESRTMLPPLVIILFYFVLILLF